MEPQSLEAELRTRARKDSDAEDFWTRYSNMKSYLQTNFYPWIQANCPFYTDHGELHIRSVIHSASQLVSDHLNKRACTSDLSSLDIFLLLSAILWHDVGNVYGRSGHAKQIANMTREVKALGFPNPNIRRIVDEIATAHGGETGLEIPREREDCSTSHTTYTVYPLALAGIVRFADEISENQSRISHALLPSVPENNRVYWEYAKAISASVADSARQKVRVTVNVNIEDAIRQLPCSETAARIKSPDIALIEYILLRLEKMNNERAYCAPHFSRYVTMREIEVSLTLMDNDARVPGYEEVVTFGDGGVKQAAYPLIEVFAPFFADHPKWTPGEITKAKEQ